MLIGHAFAFGPALIMWAPSYLSQDYLNIFRKTREFADRMMHLVGVTILTLLAADLMAIKFIEGA